MDQDLRRRAVDRAYRDHAGDVYRVAFAILRDPDGAVDATHDTFARAFERWEQYDDGSIRLQAGQLGNDDLRFLGAYLP